MYYGTVRIRPYFLSPFFLNLRPCLLFLVLSNPLHSVSSVLSLLSSNLFVTMLLMLINCVLLSMALASPSFYFFLAIVKFVLFSSCIPSAVS